MSGDRLLPQTNDFNDFVFNLNSTAPTYLKPNANQSYLCKFCDTEFSCKTTLSKHMLIHNNAEPSLANASSKITDIYKNSSTQTNQNQFVCDVCNKLFIRKENYDAHCKTHSTNNKPRNKIYFCEVCQQNFSTKKAHTSHLKRHIDTWVINGKDSTIEGVIDLKKETGSKNAYLKGGTYFKNTTEGEHLKDPARCKDLGGNGFKGKTGKKDLMARARCKEKSKSRKNKAVSEEFTCDVCNKSYKLKIAFMSHKMSHVSVKPTCEVCHKQFASNKNLKLHFRCHSDVRFFFCEMCNKGFKHKHHLRTHFITHTDEMPFVCEICNRGYKHKWGLKQHELLHAKELPFVCEVCGKAFEQGCDLDTHSSAHIRVPAKAEDCVQEIEMSTAKDPNQDVAIKIECS